MAWPRALRFLQTNLSRAAFEAQADTVAALAAGRAMGGPEKIVENLILRILPAEEPPWVASADYELVITDRTSLLVTRERWTASLQFIFLDQVPTDLLPINPLGLIVTYIQADRAAAF